MDQVSNIMVELPMIVKRMDGKDDVLKVFTYLYRVMIYSIEWVIGLEEKSHVNVWSYIQ